MEEQPQIKGACWVRVAALQRTMRKVETDSEVLNHDHARRLFDQLKENGVGMHLELWSVAFNRMLDTHTHKTYNQ